MAVDKSRLYLLIIVILIIVLAFLGIRSLYNQQISKAQTEGYDVGVTNSVVSMIQQSRNCQPLNLYIGNQTYQFIETSCLNTQQPAQ
jgi:hypothetical protein